MIPAPLPDDEKQRLEDLQSLGLLDTQPEERFDQLATLAQTVFKVPIAYIALVDANRQWFKAKCGLAVDQTGRDISFCGHTILQREPLIIPDAQQDERFFDNPLVVDEPYVRFYAGCPLAGAAGHNVGTLCLVDTKPRDFSEHEHEILVRLAAVAQRELHMHELMETQRQLLAAKERLAQTQKKLEDELSEAAEYVHSTLPEPLKRQSVTSGYRFIASSRLGGDTFGYFWLDAEHTQLAIYLLDVTGHGIGSSLLSVTVGNTLQRRALPDADFHQPDSVLASLNAAFPMEENHNKFFTMWYGVYDTQTRELVYSSAGHHPAVLFESGEQTPIMLGEPALMIGAMSNAEYVTQRHEMKPDSLMYLFSDGAFEVVTQDTGKMLHLDGLVQLLSEVKDHEPAHTNPQDNGEEAQAAGAGTMEKPVVDLHDERLNLITHRIRRMQGRFDFADDFSVVEIWFH